MSNKRVAKNTIILYIRTAFSMFIGLYSSRIILKKLGVVDFGIYDVVGGFVLLVTFINATLSSASARFISFAIGQGDDEKVKDIFNVILFIHITILIVFLIILETVGLWFVLNKLQIPDSRLWAAIWVFQFSVFKAMVTFLQIPQNALMIASEKMTMFAYLGVYNSLSKLIAAITIGFVAFDKLVSFSAVLFILALGAIIFGHIYCLRIKGYSIKPQYIKKIAKEMIGYTSWSVLGSLAHVLKTQGINIILNLFIGPSINAARGIAYQINAAVNGLIQNFTVAINPQVIKKYAANEEDEMLILVERGAKLAFFLLFILALPIYMNTEKILYIWLQDYPKYTIEFTKLVIINSLVESFSYSLSSAIQATGKIKKYQILVGGFLLLNLPISYVAMKLGYDPTITFFISILLSSIAMILRFFVVKGELPNFLIRKFMFNAVLRCFIVTVISYLLVYILKDFVYNNSTISLILYLFTCMFIAIFNIFFIGLSKDERGFIITYIKQKIRIVK